MARIIAIDYGSKRVGLAVTDPLQIIASPLETIHTKDLITFLERYVTSEVVEAFVVGMPTNLDKQATDATQAVENLIKNLKKKFPNQQIYTFDERFTSKIALNSMIQAGSKKKDRHNKSGNLDKISATIILQDFLSSRNR
ncbi:MAG: Holliday junction resolvase RuvX [Raineya sp.]